MRIDETNTTRIALTIGKKPQEEAEKPTPSGGGGVDLTGITSNNMLASNFFDRDHKQSKYTAGLLDSLKIENSFGTKLQSLVQQGGQVSPSDMDNYAKRILAADKAADKVKDAAEDEVTEAVGEEVEKNTDEMEAAVDKKINGEKDPTTPAPEAAAEAVEPSAEDETEAPETAEVPAVEAEAREGQPQTPAQALAEGDPAAAAETRAEAQPGERLDMTI